MPRLRDPSYQAETLGDVAMAYYFSGQPGRAVPLYRRNIEIRGREQNRTPLAIGLANLSDALRATGWLRESEAAARWVLSIAREVEDAFCEGISLNALGLSLAARGDIIESSIALERALRLDTAHGQTEVQGFDLFCLGQRALWLADADTAREFANRAWELARSNEGDFIRAARLEGVAALPLGEQTTADDRLSHALTRARAVNLVEEELPALTALAELRR